MTKPSRAQLRADEEAAQSIRANTIKRAQHAGVINPKRKRACLPPNLEPELGIAERRRMHVAMKYFEAAFWAEETVLHLTWCPAEFYFRPGELDAEVVLRFGRTASRRARSLPACKRRVIGAIDISFNKELGLWCVHLHALVAVRGYSKKAIKRAVEAAFGPGKLKFPELAGLKPRKAPVIRNEEHLFNTFSYVSGCVVLVDHNENQRRDRRMRSRPEGSKFSSKTMLPGELQDELTRVYADLGPRRFWVLSGFRRHGQGIMPEPPLHHSEEQAQAVLSQPREQPKPHTFSAIARPRPLFLVE